jgi:hypothetical protein
MSRAFVEIDEMKALAEQNKQLNWYAVADGAQRPALPGALNRNVNETRSLFGASIGSPLAKYSPHLVKLNSPLTQDVSWRWIRCNAGAKPCLTIIASLKSFNELFWLLANHLEVILPDGQEMYLAFWDPAILGTLIGQSDDETLYIKGPVLNRSQRAILTAGMCKWWYWDRNGKMHVIVGEPLDEEPSIVPLVLTQGQVDDLVEASVPDHIRYYIELNQPLLFETVPQVQRYNFVRESLSSARNIGLTSMGDLVNYVCLRLIYQERLYHDQILVCLLEKVRNQEQTFQEVLQELSR